jgi:hypothetical protein
MQSSQPGRNPKNKMSNLTLEERATNHETWKHIHRVQFFLHRAIKNLIDRAHGHDQSKLDHPEVEAFAKYTHELSKFTVGTPEYETNKARLGDALIHHYARNRHHPEHFKNGVNDMNLLDLLEMFCDIKAASERHDDGNIRQSVDYVANRFGFSPQLKMIFENTIDALCD